MGVIGELVGFVGGGISGMVIGGIIGGYFSPTTHNYGGTIILGAGIGGVIGLVGGFYLGSTL